MLRVIGDVHGYIQYKNDKGLRYLDLIKGCEATLQIGDLGFGKCLRYMDEVDPVANRVVLGNHDDYSNPVPHSLGDFGIATLGGATFGYIRGEHSVDKHMRTPGYDWWPQEEMDMETMNACIEFFRGKNLDLMFSHGCPHFVIDHVSSYAGRFRPSMTSMMLTEVHKVCSVNNWIFGHHHNDVKVVDGECGQTTFRCLAELSYVDVERIV